MSHTDLSSNVDATVALVASPLEWRVRVVEQIAVDQPHSAMRRRSVQCAPLRPLLASIGAVAATAGVGDSALIVLPVAPVAKGPLLEFDISGPGGSDAFLLPRADIATIELTYLMSLAEAAGVVVPAPSQRIMEAALGFTEATWQRYTPRLHQYLADGTGLDESDPALRRWIDLSDRAAALLRPYGEVSSALNSAVETPALVIPGLLDDEVLSTLDEATDSVADYLATVTQLIAVEHGDSGQRSDLAFTLLRALFDYGYHYDVMGVFHVPLDEPFVMKISDRRPLSLSVIRNSGRQSIVLADARSNHVALAVTDPNARSPESSLGTSPTPPTRTAASPSERLPRSTRCTRSSLTVTTGSS